MKIIKDEQRYNNDLGMAYRHVEAERDGHKVELNIDERGHHVRVDGEKIYPRLDEWGVVKLVLSLFGRE